MAREHAIIVDEVNPFKRQGTLFYLKRLIDLNPNVAAFADDGKLVAWCLLYISIPFYKAFLTN